MCINVFVMLIKPNIKFYLRFANVPYDIFYIPEDKSWRYNTKQE